MAVVNKPANVSLLADRAGSTCLWDLLPDHLRTRPYLVHRLDKGTSGVLLVALDVDTQRRLTRMFQQRLVRKYYVAWVTGRLVTEGSLLIDLPLTKGRKSRYRIAGPREQIRRGPRGWSLPDPRPGGHPSVTRIRTLRQSAERTLLLAAPVTGRTHQLRVHLAWIGHPIIGDHLYGRPDAAGQQAPRLQLHCHRLVVPAVGTFAAPLAPGWVEDAL